MDAAEYKHVVLGLIFLKPISDNAKKTEILLDNGKKVDIGGYLDEAMEAIERQTKSLRGGLLVAPHY